MSAYLKILKNKLCHDNFGPAVQTLSSPTKQHRKKRNKKESSF